jgi:Kdo2-lipid IVA lauroyltransferase/acyltransferase
VKVRLVDHVVYWLARIAIGTAARVPQWLGYGAASALGRLWFRFDRRRQGYSLRFLRNAFPTWTDAQRMKLARRAAGNLFKVPLDMARLTRMLARSKGTEAVLDFGPALGGLQQLQRPYIAVTAHLGNWEVAAVSMGQWAKGAHGVARVAKNPLLQKWILANREQGGLTIHPRRGGIRGMAKAVAAGGVGLQVVDQNQRLRGVFAPFFGELASCERAVVTLALRHQLQVFVGVALRKGSGFRFELVGDRVLRFADTGNKEADVLAGVMQINSALEALILRAPEQYLWMHDRYRAQPSSSSTAAASASDDDDDGE